MILFSKIVSKITRNMSSRQEENKSFLKISQQGLKFEPVKGPYTPIETRYPMPGSEFEDDPEAFVRYELSEIERAGLNIILVWNRLYPGKAVPSQTKLASKIGVCRQTMNGILKKLARLKLIYVGNRGVKRTCFYNVSPVFLRPDIRSRLRHLLPDLKMLIIASLMSVFAGDPIHASSRSVLRKSTLSNLRINKKEIYISTKVTVSRVPTACDREGVGSMEQRSQHVRGENPIPLAIRKLTPLVGLTKWGQIKLSAFPDAAIEHVIDRLQYKQEKDFSNLFGWIYVTAYRWCEVQGIEPDYAFMRSLEDIFPVPEGAEMLNERYVDAGPDKTIIETAPYMIREGIEEEIPEMKPAMSCVKSTEKPSLASYKNVSHRESLVIRQHPVWKSPTQKKEDPEEAKKRIMEWLASQEAKNFATLLGREAFEKFVAHRLAPCAEKDEHG